MLIWQFHYLVAHSRSLARRRFATFCAILCCNLLLFVFVAIVVVRICMLQQLLSVVLSAYHLPYVDLLRLRVRSCMATTVRGAATKGERQNVEYRRWQNILSYYAHFAWFAYLFVVLPFKSCWILQKEFNLTANLYN